MIAPVPLILLPEHLSLTPKAGDAIRVAVRVYVYLHYRICDERCHALGPVFIQTSLRHGDEPILR